MIAEEEARQKAAKKKPEDWGSRAKLAHYLQTLCTWVQASHDEWVTQIHYDAATGSGGVLRTKLTETAEAKEADEEPEKEQRHEWSLAGAQRQGDHEEDSAETLGKELAKIMPYARRKP